MGEHFPFRGHDISMDRFGNPHWSILLTLKNKGRQLRRPYFSEPSSPLNQASVSALSIGSG
jgi:hypothetical protein